MKSTETRKMFKREEIKTELKSMGQFKLVNYAYTGVKTGRNIKREAFWAVTRAARNLEVRQAC